MSNNLFDVSGRLALITGSTRGLGNALAFALAHAGAHVVIHGRDLSTAQHAAQLLATNTGATVHAVAFDVANANAVKAAVTQLIQDIGVPDILVNNAGIQIRHPFAEFPVEDWDRIVSANLNGVFYISRFIAPHMIERGSGKIINIASVQSLLARQTIAPYSATKGAVAQLTKGMAADLARHGIQVNAISPGYFATEMNQALVQDETFNAWVTQRTPAARWGKFEELTGALLFLASDASSFVSGQNLFVDGGMTAVV